MAEISLASDGMLSVKCHYDERRIVKEIGGRWDGVYKVWHVAFTTDNLEYLLDKFENVELSESVEKKIESQAEKEEKLAHIRKISKSDAPVRLRVPGLHLKQEDGTKKPIAPYNYQKLGIMFALTNGEGVLIADEMGLGKALAKGTELYTPHGPVPIEEVQAGDFVIGRDGMKTRVTGFYPQGVRESYLVTFSDGSSIECCDEHLWQVNTPTRKNRGNPPLVKTLREIMDSGLTRKNGKNGTRLNWYIPMVEPVNFSVRSSILEKLPPYVLGFLLGDGSLSSGRLGFSTADQEIVGRIESLMGKEWHARKCHGKYAYELSRTGFDSAPQSEEVHLFMRANGLKSCKSFENHIPRQYLIAPVEDRLELLRGLMDSDGTTDEEGSAAAFCTTSESLRDAVVWLCQSLGGRGTYGDKKPFYYDKDGNKVFGRDAWIVVISLPGGMCPFWLDRKRERYHNKREKYQPTRAISSIEKIGPKEMYCIAVDAPDKLFVTKDFIVTHNTLQAICTALMLKQKGKAKKALIVTPASLKYNWPMEIEKFTDEKYVVIDGKKPDERIAQWMRDDVFFYVVNYELLLADLFGGVILKEKEDETPEQKAKREERIKTAKRRQRILTPVRTRVWDFIACDEAHFLKNSRSKRTRNVKSLKARFRMALTGTPMDGRLEELHSVMEWVMPGLLESKTRFLQKYATVDIWRKVTGYKNIGEVTTKIAPYFIRRLKKDVLKDLPDKIYQNRIVVLTPKEMSIYKGLAEAGHEVTEDAEALVCVLRCKQFCDHPRLIGENIKSSKYEALREVLQEVVIENGNKAIIFTQFKEMLNILVELFDELGLKYLRIDGDTPKQERAKMQTQFNNDSSIDLMIGTEAMSTGLNFTSATYVINYDDNWAPAYMAQREDRAHRIGQKSVVTVVNFVCKNTIEERIRSVLYSKNVVSSEALGDDISEAVLRRVTPQQQASLL